jgi:hypothetical protein
MKKSFIALLIALFASTDAFALGGDVVTDPGSYVYFADQLRALNDQVRSAVQMLDQLDKANQMLTKVEDRVNQVGNLIYNPTSDLENFLGTLQRLQNKMEGISDSLNNIGLETFLKNSHFIDNSTNKTVSKDFLNALTKDENDETLKKLYDEYERAMNEGTYEEFSIASDRLSTYLNTRGVVFNQLKRESAYASIDAWHNYNLDEDEIQKRKDRVSNWKQHLKNIKSSEDLLKQTQITNLILLDMAEILQKQYEHTMAMDYAISLGMIAGGNAKTTNVENFEKIKNAINKDEGRIKNDESYVEDMIRKNQEKFNKMEKDNFGIPKFNKKW